MTDQPQSPDMDLIRRVQQARMLHDREATPSQVSAVYWIESKPDVDGPAPTSRAGAFILRTELSVVDALWAQLREATQTGRLGYKSKVSTSSRAGGTDREIHVLTYDADDLADVTRVRDALVALDLKPREYRRVSE
jgi:hypothetical protein